MQREQMAFDVLIIGAGPAGLAAAIHLKQRAPDAAICVIEKGAEVGAHILSGAVMDTRALDELLPDWQALGAPVTQAVQAEQFLWLSETGARSIPHALLPNCLLNQGNYIISLGNLCRWLAEQAESLGVEIYPGFAGAEVLFNSDGAVIGVATGDMGRDTPNFQPGIELLAKYTLFAEGSRGHLGKQLQARFNLNEGRDAQSYSLGIKEIWEISAAQHQPGLVIHSLGWPLNQQTEGGGFLYHLDQQQVAVGFVVGLGYQNPYLSPFEELQRYKTHPSIRQYLQGGRRIGYGARALTTGGLLALPKLSFAGGALLGDNAGFLNAARIKGSHSAIKSGMLAAHAVANALAQGCTHDELPEYAQLFEQSWLYQELHQTRNFKAYTSKGTRVGSLLFGIEQKLFGGKQPWTLHKNIADHTRLQPAATSQTIAYPKPDGALTFDRLSSVALTGVHHETNQPCHLQLKDKHIPIQVNLAQYAAPEQRYCPAGVYEIVQNQLQINASNCIHCKTCDIKDPTQNITWTVPQGGEGPGYGGM